MKESIETRVKALVSRHFNLPPSKVHLDAAFVGDLGGDPLDLIELGYQFEAALAEKVDGWEADSSPESLVGSATWARGEICRQQGILLV